MLTIPAKVIATCFALIGFAGAVVVGWAADNEPTTVLWRALIVMVVAWPIGRFIGGVALRVCEESIEAHKKLHPIPGEETDEDGTTVEVDSAGVETIQEATSAAAAGSPA